MFKTYRKFLFVRDPLERVISAYRDKFEHNGDRNFFIHAKTMAQLYRNKTERDFKLQPITFPEFIRYILSGHYDRHWGSYNGLCSPCVVRYDYIGKFDTFTEDSINILGELYNMTKIAAQNIVSAVHQNPYGKTNSSRIDQYLNQLSATDIEKLKSKYADDYNLFQFET